MHPLIHPNDAWTLWAVIVSCTAGAIWLEQSYRWAATISGPVLALVAAMLLSNVGVMPAEAASYEFVGDYLVPLAIPLLLMRANLVRIVRDSGWMLFAFHFSVLGTILGAAVATLLLHRRIEDVADVAALMTASYIGGGVNFFAVKETFGVSESLTNPLLVADNFIMAGMFLVLISISGNAWIRRRYATSPLVDQVRQVTPQESDHDKAGEGERGGSRPIGIRDISASIAIALIVVALANQTSGLVVRCFAPSFVASILGNLFVMIAVYSMLAATVLSTVVSRIVGYEAIGGFLLYLFLFTIGLPADIPAVIQNAPVLLLFCLIMATTNLVVTLTLGRIFKIDLEDLVICVSATLGGPPTALALTIAKGWHRLTAPALLVGIWGYVIGTMLGITVGELLR